jgi:hypothetical protein
VKIFDLNGKLYISQILEEDANIDVQSLSAGIYICTVLVDGKRVSYKIVKD